MPLTKEQLAERKKGIGASDAPKIMDAAEWPALWAEKTGRSEGVDLSDAFAVQLGIVTESLNLDWYEKKVGHNVTRRGEAVVSAKYPFLRCTLDGWDDQYEPGATVIQAKHVNAYSKMDEVVLRYTPQVTHEMIVTGERQAILSVIVGTDEPRRELIPFDEFFAEEYIGRCEEFWKYVVADKEPPSSGDKLTAFAPPAVMRTVDMTGNNVWAANAADWLATKKQAKTFETATKALKSLVEADVREAVGYGIVASRNKAGSVSIKECK